MHRESCSVSAPRFLNWMDGAKQVQDASSPGKRSCPCGHAPTHGP